MDDERQKDLEDFWYNEYIFHVIEPPAPKRAPIPDLSRESQFAIIYDLRPGKVGWVLVVLHGHQAWVDEHLIDHAYVVLAEAESQAEAADMLANLVTHLD